MKAVAWTIAVAALAVWSLLAWSAHALVGWASNLGASHADWVTAHPETVVRLSWASAWLGDIGQGAVMVAWLLGVC